MRGWWLAVGLLGVGSAWAGDPPKVEVAASAVLRSEYLQGQQMIVPIVVDNGSTTPLSFPDVESRPWLVRFVVARDGKPTERFTTPPASDSGATWGIAPGGHRETLLEVPSGGALAPGNYDVTVKLVDGATERVLGRKAIVVTPAKPGAVSAPYQSLLAEKAGLQAAWVHEGAAASQLYVHASDIKEPGKTIGQYYVADVPKGTTPHFTRAAPDRAWSRYIWWQSGDRTLQIAPLDGPGRAAAPVTVNFPWPKVQTLESGITDANGWLHVPFWLASARGDGQVQVLDWRPGALPAYRSVTPLTHPPDALTSTVDAAGNMRLTLMHDGRVDLYTLASGAELPAAGKKLDTPAGATPVWSGFGVRTSTPEQPGGLSVYVVDRVTRADGTAGARLRWASLAAAPLPGGGEVAFTGDGAVLDALPIGNDGLAVLYRDAAGKTWASSGTKAAPIALGANPTLVQDAAGGTWARSWGPGASPKWTLVASP